MSVTSQNATRTVPGSGVLRSGAGRALSGAFFAQGFSIAAVFTTVPAVRQHFGLSTTAVTVLLVGVSLAAGAGSFLGPPMLRQYGDRAATRLAVLGLATALLLIAGAPARPAVIGGYLLFGLALGGLDVTVNTRAAALERHHGRSVFATFYACAGAAGILAALGTAGTTGAGWTFRGTLAAAAAVVVLLSLAQRGPGRTAETVSPAPGAAGPAGRAVWVRLLPLGGVLMCVYVIDSTVSAWTTVYLHQALHATLSTAPFAYAAYQAGTLLGRSLGDGVVRRLGPVPVVCAFALLAALGLAGLALAPGWVPAVPAAGTAGLGASVLIPLTVAAAGRLWPDAPDAVLARLNVFNYAGVVTGGALSGLLGSGGHFRLAYALPACAAVLLPLAAPCFAVRGARLRPGGSGEG
ncbi:MFS transporter [Streptomyces kronopolitis]|uniref:MFS transporter n=1 Tax=Streptomyces kronopolitis TaxID=1612435 RepID=UPI00343C0F2D